MATDPVTGWVTSRMARSSWLTLEFRLFRPKATASLAGLEIEERCGSPHGSIFPAFVAEALRLRTIQKVGSRLEGYDVQPRWISVHPLAERPGRHGLV